MNGYQARSARRMGRMCSGMMALMMGLAFLPAAHGEPVTIVDDGQSALPIVAGSVDEPVQELRETIERISGAELPVIDPASDARGVYVGLVDDFPGLDLEEADDLGAEGFIMRSDGTNLYLIAKAPLGVERAVTTFLHRLGHRQFFPGEAWEVLPETSTIRGAWEERQSPTFSALRRLWYGFGAYGPSREDLNQWNDRNRMGGPEPVSIGHSWYGLDREADFEAHPEWFAEVDGERRNAKPCFSHPAVVERMIEHARSRAEDGAGSVSLSPPDGLNYCECEDCRAVFEGAEPYSAHGSLFAERPDGVLVNITSETLFNAVREVAEVMKESHPDFMIGTYAYSAYSHPPSFDLPDNVYIQTTTAFRRTPLELDEQIERWGARAHHVGIRGYWSVYQWDWDNPDPGRVEPERLSEQLRFFADHNVVALNTEASNNWGARGLGYYIGANLLWDVDADVDGLVRDFYDKAFGPAAEPMQRWYVRWYGDSVAVLDGSADLPDPGQTVWSRGELADSRRTLAEGFADLDDAAHRAEGVPGAQERVDQMRLYAYYLYLRLKQWEASAADDDEANLAAIREETRFGGRLTHTNIIHSRPLIGKAFHRRFQVDSDVWEDVPELAEWGEGERVVGEPPERAELVERWAAAKADLGVE